MNRFFIFLILSSAALPAMEKDNPKKSFFKTNLDNLITCTTDEDFILGLQVLDSHPETKNRALATLIDEHQMFFFEIFNSNQNHAKITAQIHEKIKNISNPFEKINDSSAHTAFATKYAVKKIAIDKDEKHLAVICSNGKA